MVTVEILMATYCGEKFIAAQLDSLLGQTHSALKIIVRDDGSTDKTMDIVERYHNRFPDQVCIDRTAPGRLGVRQSFLHLLENSTADYLMFCDQDDVWHEDKVERSLRELRRLELDNERETPCLVFTDLIVVDGELNPVRESFWQYQRLDPHIALNWKSLASQNVVTGCTMLFNRPVRSFYVQQKELPLFHDHLIAVVCSRFGKVAWIAGPTMKYRQHGSNVAGALRFNGAYALRKLTQIAGMFRTFSAISRSSGHAVSVLELALHKLSINLRRL